MRTRIAIIDKDPSVKELYSLELSDMGYEVLATSDVDSAKELIARCEPDVVLLDPYDGRKYRWDVLAEIRERNPHIPVLVWLPSGIVQKDFRMGPADGFIIKSFDVSDLVSKVQSLLETKGLQEGW
jgi:DNA-binding NtrC family response regulator